jgi:hypothetical protein
MLSVLLLFTICGFLHVWYPLPLGSSSDETSHSLKSHFLFYHALSIDGTLRARDLQNIHKNSADVRSVLRSLVLFKEIIFECAWLVN